MKRCHHCDAVLSSGEPVPIERKLRHDLTNAAGVTFHVRCYDSADGAAAAGPASDEHSWFAGHTWRRLFCKGCSKHVGWLFRSRTQVFSGLFD